MPFPDERVLFDHFNRPDVIALISTSSGLPDSRAIIRSTFCERDGYKPGSPDAQDLRTLLIGKLLSEAPYR